VRYTGRKAFLTCLEDFLKTNIWSEDMPPHPENQYKSLGGGGGVYSSTRRDLPEQLDCTIVPQ